ncbi:MULTISPECIES: CD3324 family protein [Paenibacillus]|uniref:Mor transcription activator domain-containing protein n=2 Tax=Paenibacillus lactis TaxID=228574 RepID=G4HAE0_9BACL|nr:MULTISPECIES: CD3324 family protein [Paenibacillus]EHB66899.1 hypothetical protein PaelaDRAFT_1123 [Paenibacillus lactis 154]MBP1893595.1 Mor family transcriptional regulator [Paenibacillus lactis]
MKYENAQHLLPDDVIKVIQQYIDGGYIYIPRKAGRRTSWGERTGAKAEITRRNREIYERYCRGESIRQLSQRHYLTEQSIRRIIRQQKPKP